MNIMTYLESVEPVDCTSMDDWLNALELVLPHISQQHGSIFETIMSAFLSRIRVDGQFVLRLLQTLLANEQVIANILIVSRMVALVTS